MRIGYQLPPVPTAIVGIVAIAIGLVIGKAVVIAIGVVLVAVAAIRLATGWLG